MGSRSDGDAPDPRAEAWRAAFQRFVDALHAPLDAARIAAAVADDVRLERHAAGDRGADGPAVAPIAETFRGVREVAVWLARTPQQVQFALVGEPWRIADGIAPGGAIWGIEYAITAGEFRNGGVWHARLAGDDRIAFLSHRPFALAE